MYDMVYAVMVESGITIMLDHKVWVDKAGHVTYKENAFGHKTHYMLTHPEMMLFVDEVGDNSSQKNDGNVEGEKLVVENNQQALI